MQMKKVLISLLAVVTLAGCGKNDTATEKPKDETATNAPVPTTLDEKAKAAMKMTDAQLLAEAKKESGPFIAYGNSSRISTAVDNFKAAYKDLGLGGDSKGSKLSDSEIYTSLASEYSAKNNSKGASFVLIQDSATLETYRENSEILTNYYSNAMTSKVDNTDLVPLTHQYINKLFIWNNLDGENAPKFSNVWELTEEKFNKKVFFKNPANEQVNMNFLITLTSPEWNTKMEAAYKAWKGTDYTKSADYKDASHEWIAKFLKNADIASYTSDTKMAAGVSTADNHDKAGLFVLSKLRDSTVTSKNLTVGAWQTNSITPFAGFMYSLYAQLATKGPRPYTAMLFTNYMMTKEGFAPWNTAVGGYSANKEIPAFEGDQDLTFYKNHLVVENGAYINTVKTEESDFINKLIAK